MKKVIILSLVTATLLLTGCGEETKKTVAEATAKTVESTKKAVDTSKEKADKAVVAAKEAAAEVKEATVKAVENAEKAVAGAVNIITDKAGKKAYAKCAGCHGKDGKTKALGKSLEIAGQSKGELVTKLNGYKAGTRNESGMGNLMKGQITTMDDAAIEAVATYISTLK